jgi:hypothetical protein
MLSGIDYSGVAGRIVRYARKDLYVIISDKARQIVILRLEQVIYVKSEAAGIYCQKSV